MKEILFVNQNQLLFMKNNYLFVNLLLLFSTVYLNAQVVNGSFENIKPNLLPSNWGMNYTQPVSIDPVTGVSTPDNVLYTGNIPALCYASLDSNSGQYAMEISNAFNQTQNTLIPGWSMIFNDVTENSPGSNPGIPVAQGDNIHTLGFYYKFLPMGNDVAEARIRVFNAQGNQIGGARVTISGTQAQYTYVYSYISYFSNDQPSSIQISFNMAKQGSTPSFGSRLIIDNVVTNFEALSLIENPTNNREFKVFPTLVDSEISVVTANDAFGMINYKVFNTEGRLIKENNEEASQAYVYEMNLSELTPGIYFLQIESNLGKAVKKIIKR